EQQLRSGKILQRVLLVVHSRQQEIRRRLTDLQRLESRRLGRGRPFADYGRNDDRSENKQRATHGTYSRVQGHSCSRLYGPPWRQQAAYTGAIGEARSSLRSMPDTPARGAAGVVLRGGASLIAAGRR